MTLEDALEQVRVIQRETAERCAAIADQMPHRKGHTVAALIRDEFGLENPPVRPIDQWRNEGMPERAPEPIPEMDLMAMLEAALNKAKAQEGRIPIMTCGFCGVQAIDMAFHMKEAHKIEFSKER